ncbi:hypothetical protein LJY25_06725 [Hymenobacter sp. BT175]|uniref:hypothetical protein n=1 Tax=Hymenobacter translucens TaxID=2886507 RepID=UPI001D0E1A1E|nr:hypothetical protein [Hymenobacter translucens]MCC2546132.1 hypothetical protein [Hymenobacter translucens]
MAEISIQRKKSSPSPWLIVLLVLAVLAVLGYFLLRPDANPEPDPAAAPATGAVAPVSDAEAEAIARATPPPADGGSAVAAVATEEGPATPDELADFAEQQTAQPDYARRGLQMLSATLVDLADRSDLRDPGVNEKRDMLTSATSRINEPKASLRPGFVAAAALMQAMQQKAYPDLETPVAELSEQANQLSGRNTADEQTQAFFTKAAQIVRTLSQPAS